jgi:hypothetical protein
MPTMRLYKVTRHADDASGSLSLRRSSLFPVEKFGETLADPRRISGAEIMAQLVADAAPTLAKLPADERKTAEAQMKANRRLLEMFAARGRRDRCHDYHPRVRRTASLGHNQLARPDAQGFSARR